MEQITQFQESKEHNKLIDKTYLSDSVRLTSTIDFKLKL